MKVRAFCHWRRVPAATALLAVLLALGACAGMGTKLQRPTARIQQLTVNGNGTWDTIVRFQNYSYDTGMHVYSIDATLNLDGKPAGHVTISPSLDVPAMNADIATATLRPDASGKAALAAAKGNAVRYELRGTLMVGAGSKGRAQSFKLHSSGYISPVPGVSNVWR